MNVKQLRELLSKAKDEDQVVISVDGSIYPVYDDDTVEQLDGYLEANEFGISVDVTGCP
jgi:hypothetical protein